MIIFAWIICLVLFAATLLVLSFLFVRSNYCLEHRRILWEGFRKGLRGCGLNVSKKKLPVELWKWETMEDDEVCEDCLERASWPPMDIADWMKVGMPGTPEAQTDCTHGCRCRLVPYKPHAKALRRPRKQ